MGPDAPQREDYPNTQQGLHAWAQAAKQWNDLKGIRSQDLVKQWNDERKNAR